VLLPGARIDDRDEIIDALGFDSARSAILKAIDSMPASRFESVDAFARALA